MLQDQNSWLTHIQKYIGNIKLIIYNKLRIVVMVNSKGAINMFEL